MAAAHGIVVLLIAVFITEQAAIQEWQIVARNVRLGTLGAEFGEEGTKEPLKESGSGRGIIGKSLESPEQVVALAVEPAFSLDEIQEQEPIEEGLRLLLGGLVFPMLALANLILDHVEGFGEVVEELLVQFFDGKRLNDVRDSGAVGFVAQLGKALRGRPTGFVGAQDVGVATRGGLTANQVAVSIELGHAGGKGEPVVLLRGKEDRQNAMVLGLVNEPGDQVAETDAVAKQVNALRDLYLKNGELFAITEADTGKLI
ncbi:MAG TPA: hypothetical protein P5186_13835 [Candidatus Paceibacterota bacterium]|nr:hypothetical protein [Verrucomicrobiota bacterium]HRY49124.1 hypothetical protein [Candidatus Paceibacterota bacterium]